MDEQPKMDLPGFMAWLWENWAESGWMDIDGYDMHEEMLRYGLLYDRPITEEEANQEWAKEWGIRPGGINAFKTDEFQAFLKQTKSAAEG